MSSVSLRTPMSKGVRVWGKTILVCFSVVAHANSGPIIKDYFKRLENSGKPISKNVAKSLAKELADHEKRTHGFREEFMNTLWKSGKYDNSFPIKNFVQTLIHLDPLVRSDLIPELVEGLTSSSKKHENVQ